MQIFGNQYIINHTLKSIRNKFKERNVIMNKSIQNNQQKFWQRQDVAVRFENIKHDNETTLGDGWDG